MRILMIALLGLSALGLTACGPMTTPTRNVVPEAKPYARMILEGPDSIDSLATLAVVTDSGDTGFAFLGFNEERSAVATSYIPIAGLPARVYFVAEDIKQGENVTGTLFRVLTDPAPPPLPQRFEANLVKLADALKAKFGDKLYSIKLERER
jgi:hypothetical protein